MMKRSVSSTMSFGVTSLNRSILTKSFSSCTNKSGFPKTVLNPMSLVSRGTFDVFDGLDFLGVLGNGIVLPLVSIVI